VPAGAVNVDILHGFERRFEQRHVTATAGQAANVEVNLDAGTWSVPDAAHLGERGCPRAHELRR